MLPKDELISRIQNLNSELSPQFLRGYSENVLSAYLCFLDMLAKLDPDGEGHVQSLSTLRSPSAPQIPLAANPQQNTTSPAAEA